MSADNIPPDVIYEKRFTVTEDMIARGVGLDVKVLSTPSLVLAMEITAHESVVSYLSEKETTVGGGICINHLRPTKLGEHFVVVVRIKSRERSKITFLVEAFNSLAKIAEGEHVRFVVNKEKFASQISGK